MSEQLSVARNWPVGETVMAWKHQSSWGVKRGEGSHICQSISFVPGKRQTTQSPLALCRQNLKCSLGNR